jgi:hypothetical protein
LHIISSLLQSIFTKPDQIALCGER